MSDKKNPVTNQSSISDPLEASLRAYPQFVPCSDSKCEGGAPTKVTNKYNMISLVTCICCAQCWMLYRFLKKKDINCYDATHECRSCGKHLYDYKSC